jgi:hypothetical protein
MRSALWSVSALAALCLGSVPVTSAQTAPAGTKRPKILQIGREELKPGKGAAHVKNEMGWPAAYRKAGSKSSTLAITSASEAWFLSPYESFAALEAQTKADEGDAVLSAEVDRLWSGRRPLRTTQMTAVLRSLGYRADWDVARCATTRSR